MPYKERRGASPQTNDMQNIQNFIDGSVIMKLMKVGNVTEREVRKGVHTRQAYTPWDDEAVVTESNDSIEAWAKFANACDWLDWLDEEANKGIYWDEEERARLSALVYDDPTWGERRLYNWGAVAPWQECNPQTVNEAVEYMRGVLEDCDENEADCALANILGVDCWGMEKVGTNSYVVNVWAEAPLIGFDKFSPQQRLQIAVLASDWQYNEIVYNASVTLK